MLLEKFQLVITIIFELTGNLLADARAELTKATTLSVPIAQLTTLGAGVASLAPALNTVTQTISFDTSGLYRVANQAVGDTLKIAKNGNSWGALKNRRWWFKACPTSVCRPPDRNI